MCYSALVNQHSKALGLTYQARIQIDLFEDVFKERLAGSGAKIPRAMEAAFLEAPKSAPEMRIAKYIRDFHKAEIKDAKEIIATQGKRLAAAEKALAGKVTKKAQNDQRVATEKIEKAKAKIERIEAGKIGETDSRIWPGMYAPLITMDVGERVIRPFRYLLRPRGQSADFDRKYNGSYNMRRDRLKEVMWWKSIFGRNHGAMEIKAFFENVPLSKTRKLKKGEEDSNLILRFDPKDGEPLLVPCMWDTNDADETTLYSFALVTDTPNPEVAAAGHDRTPIIMKPANLDLWLTTGGKDLSVYEKVFDDKKKTYFEHEVAA